MSFKLLLKAFCIVDVKGMQRYYWFKQESRYKIEDDYFIINNMFLVYHLLPV